MKIKMLALTKLCVCVSCSVMSSSLQPMDCSPPGFSVHEIDKVRDRLYNVYFKSLNNVKVLVFLEFSRSGYSSLQIPKTLNWRK